MSCVVYCLISLLPVCRGGLDWSVVLCAVCVYGFAWIMLIRDNDRPCFQAAECLCSLTAGRQCYLNCFCAVLHFSDCAFEIRCFRNDILDSRRCVILNLEDVSSRVAGEIVLYI